MNGRAYSVDVGGAKYGVNFGSALAIAISYTTNHSILWAITTKSSGGCTSSIRAVPRTNPVGAEDTNSGILASESVDRFVLESGHSTSRGVITGFDP